MITHHGIQESCAALHFIEIKAHGDCRTGNDTEVPLGVILSEQGFGCTLCLMGILAVFLGRHDGTILAANTV